jgi:hypothetical protein
VKINGISHIYYATPGESLTLTGSWNEVYFSDIIPGYIPYCPGCITQNYIGMANDQFSGNVFDVCYDVTGLSPVAGTINNTFTAPSRPGVYYITQQSSWNFFCYQFGHQLHDQIAKEAIAVIIINPSDGITPATTATIDSPEGTYPITIGGCHYNSNYRVILQDGNLTVSPVISLKRNDTGESPTEATRNGIRVDMLYPNPASSIIRLQLKDDVHSAGDLRVYDGVGKLHTTLSRKVNNGVYEINVSGLSRGVYIIEARTAAGIKTFKFIKK